MAELHIASRLVETDAATVFAYLGDMNNYEEMMPESVYEWQSTQDSCNFKIKGLSAMTSVHLYVQQKYTAILWLSLPNDRNRITKPIRFWRRQMPQRPVENHS